MLEQIRALDDAYHWVDGYSLIHERTLKVPLEYARLISGPNGKATGNNLEEAIIHAALEIFERRAHITALRHRMVLPTIDPATITHPIVREQLAFFHSRGIEVIFKDLSFGGVLPCLAAYFVDHNIPGGLPVPALLQSRLRVQPRGSAAALLHRVRARPAAA